MFLINLNTEIVACIQLFGQRLSRESVKAYATMPIGIMGCKSLALLDWGSRRFSNKERERTNTSLCCFLSPRWNTSRFTQATVKNTITHSNFRHCRVSFSPFVRQPFSKQLYYHSENRAASQIWKILPNMVFPSIWGEKWRRSELAHASYPGLFFRPPGFSPYMVREERRVQGLDYHLPYIHESTFARIFLVFLEQFSPPASLNFPESILHSALYCFVLCCVLENSPKKARALIG